MPTATYVLGDDEAIFDIDFEITDSGSAGHFNPITGAGEAPSGPEWKLEEVRVVYNFQAVMAGKARNQIYHTVPLGEICGALEDRINEAVADYLTEHGTREE